MNLVAMLLMAISSNLDNIGVGLAYGLRNIRISFSANLLIAAITSAGTFLAMSCGQTVSTWFPLDLAKGAGSLLLGATGLWVIWQGLCHNNHTGQVQPISQAECCCSQSHPVTAFARIYAVISNPAEADLDFSGDISLHEAAILGLALTMNNIAAGLGAGLLGMNSVITTLFVFLLSFLALSAGLYCGTNYTSRRFGQKTFLLSGTLLVIIGCYEYIAP